MTHPLPNPDEEAERQMMIPAGPAGHGRRVAAGYLRAAGVALVEGNMAAADFGVELAMRHDPATVVPDWYNKRAHGPRWDNEFLDACTASGAIVECGAERGPGASWVRVLTVIGFVALCVAAATVGIWIPR